MVSRMLKELLGHRDGDSTDTPSQYHAMKSAAEKLCDGEFNHDEFRDTATDLIGKMSNADLTKLAETIHFAD